MTQNRAKVTTDGTNWNTLDEFTAAGNRPAANSQNAQQAQVRTPGLEGASGGGYAIRAGMVNNGVDNDRIGWNERTGSITLDGQDVFRPAEVTDGTSYGSLSDVNRITNKAYEMAGNPLVAARQYLDNAGYGGSVTWDNDSGTVNFAGTVITPAYVTPDGIAYVPQSELDRAIEAYKQRTGQRSADEVYSNYRRTYSPHIAEALRRLNNFQYDAGSDPVYQAYAEQYGINGESARRAALNAQNASATNNSAAAAEANAAYNSYMSRLDAVIPELAQMAYDRTRNRLFDTIDVANDDYSKALEAYKNANDQARYDRQYHDNRMDTIWNQNMQEWERGEQAAKNALEREGMEIANEGARLDNTGRELSNAAQDEANRQAAIENIVNRGYQFGGYGIDPDTQRYLSELMGWRWDGKQYTDRDGNPVKAPWYSEGEYNRAMGLIDNELALKQFVDKLRANYNAKLGVF